MAEWMFSQEGRVSNKGDPGVGNTEVFLVVAGYRPHMGGDRTEGFPLSGGLSLGPKPPSSEEDMIECIVTWVHTASPEFHRS